MYASISIWPMKKNLVNCNIFGDSQVFFGLYLNIIYPFDEDPY